MTEPRAWLFQAEDDYRCANHLIGIQNSSGLCHVIAKCQQAVEKSIKALVAALRDNRGMSIQIGWTHAVERFMSGLTRLPRSNANRDIQNIIRGLLDENTRGHIRASDRMVPRRPPPGKPPALNTEYPFPMAGDWRAPAEKAIFTRADADRFRTLAHRVVEGCSQLISAIERVS